MSTPAVTPQSSTGSSKPKPKVFTEEDVKKAADDDEVFVLRGSRLDSAKRMYETGCVRGDKPDPNCGRPTEEEVISQVGGPQSGKEHFKFPEFTTEWHWAQTYATNCIVMIAIKKKYLTKGSVSECGWVCYDAAPCRVAGVEPYKGTANKSLVNSKTGKKLIAD
ncbi:MAG: DUF4765 family protein [Acidobacteriaceae bacterium]